MLKKKKETCDCLKTVLSRHSVSHPTRNIFVTKTTKIWPQTRKNPVKTHIEALKIQKKIRGRPPKPPNERGINPPLVLTPNSCLRHSMASSAGPLLNTRRRPCKYNAQMMNTAFLKAQDVTDITFQRTYGIISICLMFKLILQNLKVY